MSGPACLNRGVVVILLVVFSATWTGPAAADEPDAKAAELDARRLIGKAHYENAETPPQFEPAVREFKRIDETHHPEPLPDEVLAELDRILAAADREAEKLG